MRHQPACPCKPFCFISITTADSSDICLNQFPPTIGLVDCSSATCDCPTPPYPCPPDSIIVSTRLDPCCVSYECVCPSISCPLLMECGQGVQPIPNYRGNGFPGRCCPDYGFEGEAEYHCLALLMNSAWSQKSFL